MKLTNIHKLFYIDNQPTKKALINISLSFPSKGNVFIVGKSGSGKTTLLNIIGGIDQPTSGSIHFGGHELTTFSSQKLNAYRNDAIGFVFQDYNLIDTLTISQNLSVALSLKANVDSKLISETLSLVGLNGFESRMPSTLSGGERQRVAIARALLKKPKILLADEPTGALDTETSKEIFLLLKKLSSEILIITVSHDRESAISFADRVIEIKDGSIIFDSLPENHQESMLPPFQYPKLKIIPSFLLGVKNIRKISVRLVLSLLIAMSLLLVLGLSDSASSYDRSTQILESLSSSTSPWILINQRRKTNQTEDELLLINDSMIINYQNLYSGNSFYPVHLGFERSIQDLLFDDVESNDLYPGLFAGAMVMTDSILAELNLSLVAGELPTEEHHMVITKRIYEHFLEYGLKNEDSRIVIDSYQDLIGLSIDFGSMGVLSITGIIDTEFNPEKYKVLFNGSNISPLLHEILSQELAAVNGSIHEMVFISTELSNQINSQLNDDYVIPAQYVGSLELSTELSVNHNSIAKLQSYDYKDLDILWINGHSELSDDMVLLNYEYVRSFMNIVTLLTRSDQLIDAFVSDHYDEIQAQFESEQTITYQEYIKSSVTNIYHPSRGYEFFFNQAFTDELEELLNSTNNDASLSFSKNQTTYVLEIAGVFKSEEPIDFDTVIVSGSQYESLIDLEQIYPYHSMITLLGSEFSSNQALIHDLMNLTGQVYLIGRNDILSNVSFLGSLFEGISNVLTFVTFGIGVLTLLILFTFIYSSIQHHQKDIGILRSMGAGFKHIYAWFTAESLILLGLSALLSASLLGITSFAMNQMVKVQATINVSLLVTSPRQYFLIVAVALMIACISTLIPVVYYVRKNPIDSIRLN